MAVFKVAAAIVGLGYLVVSPASATTTETGFFAPVSSRLTAGTVARAPIGFVELCRTLPQTCARHHASVEIPVLDQDSWSALVRVNRQINQRIRPVADITRHGKADVWSVNPLSGDCEDYALTKQNELIQWGWPRSALLVAVVRDERGSQHAVLVARTDRGDFVLDNREADVRPWKELPYRWIKLQSSTHAGHWVRLSGYVEEMIARKEERLRRLIRRAAELDATGSTGMPSAVSQAPSLQ